jgi:hypothetical protein
VVLIGSPAAVAHSCTDFHPEIKAAVTSPKPQNPKTPYTFKKLFRINKYEKVPFINGRYLHGLCPDEMSKG